MERCIHKHLYNYVLSNHILTPLHSGFVSADSTTFQLLHTYHMFCEAVYNGKEVRAYSVISAKLLIGSGIKGYSISYVE